MMSLFQEHVAIHQRRQQQQKEDENETQTLQYNVFMNIVNDHALSHKESVTKTLDDKCDIPTLRLLTKTKSFRQVPVHDDNRPKMFPRKQRTTPVRAKSLPSCRWENGLHEIKKSNIKQDSILQNPMILSHYLLTSKSRSKTDTAPRLPSRRKKCPSLVHDLINILDEAMLI